MRLKELREQKNLSQQEIATALNEDINTIERWEEGFELPSEEKRAKLAYLLGGSISYLL